MERAGYYDKFLVIPARAKIEMRAVHLLSADQLRDHISRNHKGTGVSLKGSELGIHRGAHERHGDVLEHYHPDMWGEETEPESILQRRLRHIGNVEPGMHFRPEEEL